MCVIIHSLVLAKFVGNFKSGEVQGTILKKLCGSEEDCFNLLMSDALKPFVPEYKRVVIKEDESKIHKICQQNHK